MHVKILNPCDCKYNLNWFHLFNMGELGLIEINTFKFWEYFGCQMNFMPCHKTINIIFILTIHLQLISLWHLEIKQSLEFCFLVSTTIQNPWHFPIAMNFHYPKHSYKITMIVSVNRKNSWKIIWLFPNNIKFSSIFQEFFILLPLKKIKTI